MISEAILLVRSGPAEGQTKFALALSGGLDELIERTYAAGPRDPHQKLPPQSPSLLHRPRLPRPYKLVHQEGFWVRT